MKIKRITTISQPELDLAFEIIKNNMTKLDFVVSESDKIIWQNSFKKMLNKQNVYIYFFFKDDKLSAFFELESENQQLSLHEIQLSDNVKHTFVLLNILQFLLYSNEFERYNTIKFSILKNNDMSNKTFTHLGGKKIAETKNKYYYSLTRQDAAKVLSKFDRYQQND